jgi:hypothetical protein
MYLRHTTVNKNGKSHTYWRLVRSVRTNVVVEIPVGKPWNKLRTMASAGSFEASGTGVNAAATATRGFSTRDPLPGTWTLAKFGASHDNAIASNIVHSSGPTGQERSASVAPAFVGGIVVLNGTYNNKIVNNQAWANGGGTWPGPRQYRAPPRRSGCLPQRRARPCFTRLNPGQVRLQQYQRQWVGLGLYLYFAFPTLLGPKGGVAQSLSDCTRDELTRSERVRCAPLASARVLFSKRLFVSRRDSRCTRLHHLTRITMERITPVTP